MRKFGITENALFKELSGERKKKSLLEIGIKL